MLEINQSRPAHWCNSKKHASKQLLGKTLQNPTTLIFEGGSPPIVRQTKTALLSL